MVRLPGRAGARTMMAVTLFAHIALLLQAAPLPAAGAAGLERHVEVARSAAGVLRLRGGKTGGIKARDMWEKPIEELTQMEEELRLELMSLRVAQQVGGQPGRVNQIRKVRKSIARVLTVVTAKRRADAYELVKKKKFKPLDARLNRNMPKAMRQRLNKFERTRISNKAIRCLRLKVWGAGVRPMRRLVLTSPLDTVYLGACPPEEERSFEKYPKRKQGQHGKATSTGHIPVHAQTAMDKRKAKYKKEKERMAAFTAKYADDGDE